MNFTGGLHHAMPGRGPAASASTTTSRWRSTPCWRPAPNGSPTSTSTSTTATGSNGSSGTTPGYSPSRCTRPARRCSRGPGGRRHRRAVRDRRRGERPAASGTGDAGWLRAFDAVGAALLRAFQPESWSPSTAATPTPWTRWPTWPCPSTPSGSLLPRCTSSPTSYAAAAGSPSAAVATRWSTWSRGPGRTWSGSPRPGRSPSGSVPDGWRAYVRERYGRPAPSRMTDGRDAPPVPVMGRRMRPGGPAGPGGDGHPAGGVPAARAGPLVRLTGDRHRHAA